jgi:hypothetical protein
VQYLKYTYVDAVTGVPCTVAPMHNGPAMPAVPGLQHGFAMESEYPTRTPTFYGTAPDDAPTDAPGVLAVVSADDYEAARRFEYEATIPKAVTMRQARLALLAAGKLEQVNAAIASMSEPQRSAAHIEWEYAQVVQRGSALVVGLAEGLGMYPEQMDALFVAADKL